MPSTDQLNKSVWMLASIAVVVAALYLAKDVLIPLTLAVLLSFLLSPACDRLERHGLGRIPAVAVTALIGFAVLGAATWTAAVQIADLAPKMPEYQKNLQAKLHSTNAFVSAGLHQISVVAENFGPTLSPSEQSEEPKGTSEHPFSVRVLPSTTSPAQLVGGSFGSLVQVLGSSGIVIVLVVFFLIRREDLRDRFIRLVGTGQVTVTTQMLEDAATRVSRYLSMLFIVNATFGISVGIGLSLIGVPNAVLWGILAAILRFIPYIGPWIAAAMPIGLSMAISSAVCHDLLDFCARVLAILAEPSRELPSARLLGRWGWS
jgi:predicted PurR-regulated permease PerM